MNAAPRYVSREQSIVCTFAGHSLVDKSLWQDSLRDFCIGFRFGSLPVPEFGIIRINFYFSFRINFICVIPAVPAHTRNQGAQELLLIVTH